MRGMNKKAIALGSVWTGIILALLGFLEGGRQVVDEDPSFIGGRRIAVTRRAGKARFRERDIEVIEKIPGVSHIHLGGDTVEISTSTGNRFEIWGYSPRAMDKSKLVIVSGRGMPVEKGSILINRRAARDEWGDADAAGRVLEVMGEDGRDIEFLVQGVYQEGMDRFRRDGEGIIGIDELGGIKRGRSSYRMIVVFESIGDARRGRDLVMTVLKKDRRLEEAFEAEGENERYRNMMKAMAYALPGLIILYAAGIFFICRTAEGESWNEWLLRWGIIITAGTAAGVGMIYLLGGMIDLGGEIGIVEVLIAAAAGMGADAAGRLQSQGQNL